MKVKYFRITGGRANITGAITRGNYVADIAYRSSIRFFAKVRMTKRAGKRVKQSLALRAESLSNNASGRVLAKVVLKPKR